MHQAYQSNEQPGCNLCYCGRAQGTSWYREYEYINPSFQPHGQHVSLCVKKYTE